MTRARSAWLFTVLALAGAATMAVELAAVRLIAPWYGAAAVVWTNVIGVILLALALGYLLGARLSRRSDVERSLGLVLSGAALLTAWIPAGAAPVAELFLPARLSLDEAATLLGWGSLASSAVLFLPPALCLGCVGPLAVERLVQARGGHAGDAGGRVLAASTLGSLAGTFGTTHVSIPELGLERTFGLSALVLLVCGLSFAWRRRGGRALALGWALLALPAFALGRSAPRPREGWKVLEEGESAYQTVRAVELPAAEGEVRGLRYLQVNESFDSFQSVAGPATGLLPPGFYYNHFVPPLWWEGAPARWRVLVLGLGAGTAVRVLEGTLPPGTELSTAGVELDARVVEMGERWFDLERRAPDRRVLAGLDARAALRGDWGEPFDQVVLDCYAHSIEVPPHLSTIELFREALGVLRDGGWITLNAAGFGLEDPVVTALAGSLAEAAAERVLGLRVPFSRNCVLHARRGAVPPEPGGASWRVAHPELARLLARCELPGAWRWFEPGASGPRLTDDRNRIERLQAQSIREGRRRWLDP